MGNQDIKIGERIAIYHKTGCLLKVGPISPTNNDQITDISPDLSNNIITITYTNTTTTSYSFSDIFDIPSTYTDTIS